MFENIKLAFQGIWAHKMRSFLTMLGVIIGIASIMTIVSTIKGTNEQTRQNLIGSGNNALELVYTVEGGDPSAQTGVQAPISFPKDLMESIEDLSVIKSCAPYYSMQTQSYGESVYYGNTNLQGYLIGTTNDYLSVFGYQVQRGRAFVDRDFDNHQKSPSSTKRRQARSSASKTRWERCWKSTANRLKWWVCCRKPPNGS